MMPKLKPSETPKALQHPAVKGVFTGGCVARGDGSSFRHTAHAHMINGDKHQGWICVRAARRLIYDEELCIHELAHIVSKAGHTDKWRKCVRDLCHEFYPNELKANVVADRILKDYQKKPRHI